MTNDFMTLFYSFVSKELSLGKALFLSLLSLLFVSINKHKKVLSSHVSHETQKHTYFNRLLHFLCYFIRFKLSNYTKNLHLLNLNFLWVSSSFHCSMLPLLALLLLLLFHHGLETISNDVHCSLALSPRLVVSSIIWFQVQEYQHQTNHHHNLFHGTLKSPFDHQKSPSQQIWLHTICKTSSTTTRTRPHETFTEHACEARPRWKWDWSTLWCRKAPSTHGSEPIAPLIDRDFISGEYICKREKRNG